MLIEAGSKENTTTIKCNKDGDDTYETTLVKDQDLYSGRFIVWGGGQNKTVENTSITMTGGKVNKIIGGGCENTNNGEAPSVTGKAEITIKGGRVGALSAGSEGGVFHEISVKQASILVEGGYIENLGIAGETFNTKSEKTNIIEEVSLIIKGGTIARLVASTRHYSDSHLVVGKVSAFQIASANVAVYQDNSYGAVTFKDQGPQDPTGLDGKTILYPVELDLECNGAPYLEQKIDSVYNVKGKVRNLTEAYTYELVTNPNDTVKKARLTVWLPKNTQVDAAVSASDSFVNQKKEIIAGTKYASGTLTNLVKIPTLLDPQPTYSGASISGLQGVISATLYAPYNITGDMPNQINAGSYKTVFTLKKGFKWEDGSTKAKTYNWSIKKATQSHPYILRTRAESGYQKNDGAVLELKENMEYSVDKKKWISLAGKLDKSGNLNGLAPGTYYFRYAETPNLIASDYTQAVVSPAQVYLLSLLDYETGELLEIIPGEVIVDGSSKAYFPEKYMDYGLFSRGSAGEADVTFFVKTEKDGRRFLPLYVNTSLYALPPVYEEAQVSFDLKDSKKSSIVLENDSLLRYASAQTRWENRIAEYFYKAIRSMAKEGVFGNQSNMTTEELERFICDNTFYVTPCAADSTLLTKEELDMANQACSDVRVIPHITLTPQEDSVLAVDLDIEKPESIYMNDKITVNFTGQKKDGVSTVTVLELGKVPDAGQERILLREPVRNVVYTITKLSVKYGSGEDPDDKPTDGSEESGSKEPGSDEAGSKDPGSQEGGSDQTKEPETGPSEQMKEDENGPVKLAEQEKIITGANTDKSDPKGACFRYLRPGLSKAKKHELTLSWKKIKKADGYVIYGAKCGSKMKRLKTIDKASKHSCKLKKLKSGTYYKYIVVAYQNTDAGEVALYTSTSVHAATSGGRKNNPLGIRLKNNKLKVKKKKAAKIRGTIKKKGKVQFHIAMLRYESLNTKIATVNKKGKVKGRKKGKTSILVYTQNGIWKKVPVTIK
ncbi:MAG: Ig-like domain-containing protein [Lachnospiraceae bacterium]|nr:Ig-like domain-containing protein [Lachnospiraceae bacterium]